MTNETKVRRARVRVQDLEETKELKLQLPLRTHVRLQSAKVLRGQTIGAMVEAALDAYFARRSQK